MKFALPFVLVFFAFTVSAHKPIIVDPESSRDYITVTSPEISWAYYGELDGFAHMYEIRAAEPFLLHAQVLEPDIREAKQNHSMVIVRERDNGRGVELVARRLADEAEWTSFYEPFGGDSYLEGRTFEEEVPAGVYRIEVSTDENEGKYVLSVGKIEDFSDTGYFETLGKIYQVKRFFGKSPISIFTSPFVYVPTIVLLVLFLIGRFIYKKYYG